MTKPGLRIDQELDARDQTGGARFPEKLAETTNSALTAIGGRIREARLSRGMTLQSLAAASGLSPSMLSLVERGRATPSIGSLIVIANALGVTMSEIVATVATAPAGVVVRRADHQIIETARHVIRRVLREDPSRGISIAINEYEPDTGSSDRPVSHDGYEYGLVLEGTLTIEVDGMSYVLTHGDLISYNSRKPHKIWNHGKRRLRTLWINLRRE